MTKKEIIPVVMCSDENGADFMQVAIRSILLNTTDAIIDLHIITDGFIFSTSERILSLVSETSENHLVTIHTINPEEYNNYNGCGDGYGYPKAACFRFATPEILKQYKKIIYLDTDIIAESSLLSLWKINMEGQPLAAVSDIGDRTLYGEYINNTLGYLPGEYFNSGVMIMNLEYFREHNISDLIKGYLSDSRNPAQFPDQDALNRIFKGKIKYLPPKYNSQAHHHFYPDDSALWENPGYIEARNNPSIIHFNGFKPWHIVGIPNYPIFKERFEYYRKLLPEINVKRKPLDQYVNRRRIQWWLFKLHLIKRCPNCVSRIPQFNSNLNA